MQPTGGEGAVTEQRIFPSAYRRDGSFAIAGQINENIAVGDWTMYLTLLEKLKTVTAADVQRVAQAYFKEDQSTTGWFIPQPEAPPAGDKSPPRRREFSTPDKKRDYEPRKRGFDDDQ